MNPCQPALARRASQDRNAAMQKRACGRRREWLVCAPQQCGSAALSAFLDVSSLNLAVPQAPPFFCSGAPPDGLAGDQFRCLSHNNGDNTGQVTADRVKADPALDPSLIHI